MNHDTKLEIMFTTVPTFIVGATIVPSFMLLYDNSDWMDIEFEMSVGVTGNQWY